MGNNTWQKRLKSALMFGLFYIIIFNCFFLKWFADSSETTGMFIIFSFLQSIIIVLPYIILRGFINPAGRLNKMVADLCIFFILTELYGLILVGHPVFFGLFPEKGHAYVNDHLDVFHYRRDFSLSMASIIAATLCALVVGWRNRRVERPAINAE